jgi:HEAT repeat protein
MHLQDSNLIEQLKDPNREQRVSAARALGESDRLASSSIPPLIETLQDVDSEVRLSALASLINIWRAWTGPTGELLAQEEEIDHWLTPLSRSFRDLLHDESKFVRLGAAEGLRDLYCADNVVFDAFLEAARDGDESLRRRAALALWLGYSDRRAPLWQVETEPGIAVLMDLLRDQSKEVRNYALRAVSSVGVLANSAAPAVLALLDDEDKEVGFNAALALAGLGSGAEAALPVLVDVFTDGDRLKRKAAAYALRRMGTEAKAALPILIKGLQDHEKRVRSRCADTIGLIGAEVGDEALLALIEAESDEDQEVRSAVQRALEAIGKERVDATRGKSERHQTRDAYPLFGFKPEEIPGLIGMLRDPNPGARGYAVTALGYLGAREAVPDLIELLHDEDEDVRRRAAKTLKIMGVVVDENG